MKKSPTIIDIAKTFNISSSTVSRALRNTKGVGSELRAKILQESHKIGYSPNRIAKAFRNKANHIIGVIVPTFEVPQIDELVDSIQNTAEKLGHGILVGVSQWDTDRELKLLDFMVSMGVKGIIIKSKGDSEALERMHALAQQNIKIVSILDEISFPQVSSVIVDNIQGGYMAGKHLLELGHINILYATYASTQIKNAHSWHFSNDRYIGMLKAYEQAGIKRPSGLAIYDDSTIRQNKRRDTFLKALEQKLPFSAIFAYDDQLAIIAASILKQHGYSIPNDVSIIGFDDSLDIFKYCECPLTVIKQPNSMVGEQSVNLVIDPAKKYEYQNSKTNLYTLPPTLIDRGSTCRPKTGQITSPRRSIQIEE
ncbi:MAG: LacI family transcriptional regulator [Planctomycetaceae bacterium]|nr:LacI family transcriptional regulator [Planctomycetaceae bacterium]